MFNVHAKQVFLFVNVPTEQRKAALSKLNAYCNEKCEGTGLISAKLHHKNNGNFLAIIKVTMMGVYADQILYHTNNIEAL